MAPFSNFLAVAGGDASSANPILTPYGWTAFVLLLAAGLLIGHADVLRLSWMRIWALSGTCFTESMRRRILLVTPLAIAGVIVVVQLQRSTDEQDSIRQTIKFCLFASGLLVTLVALILACSNLPREIENRVIFTIVTKPTTRLEIVLGKVVGFARVSAVVLLIMGLFTFAFLKFRNWTLVNGVRAQLVSEPAGSARRPTLAHYLESGFLGTKSLNTPDEVRVYSRLPLPTDEIRWLRGGESQYFLLPFELSDAEQEAMKTAGQQGIPVAMIFNVDIERHTPTAEEAKVIRELNLVAPAPKILSGPLGPELPTTKTAVAPLEAPAQVRIRFLDENHRQIVKSDELDTGTSGLTLHAKSDKGPSGVANLPPSVSEKLAANRRFLAEVSAITPAVEFGIGKSPAVLFVPTGKDQGVYIRPPENARPQFLATNGRRGMLISPSMDGDRSVALFRFHNATINGSSNGKVAFEIDATFEKSADSSAEATPLAQISVDVINRKTGASSGSLRVAPDLNRTTYFDVPMADVDGGEFDIAVRNHTPGQLLGLGETSLSMITADRSFAVNLSKSMFILWLMSVLVVSISVFCSTFVSWPIAVVLTLVILLGRWGVLELGDALNPGVGRFVSADLQLSDPTSNLLMSNSIEGLTKFLKAVSALLPDVTRFPVVEDIEQGISIPIPKVAGALEMMLIYSLGMVIGSYIILKYKEVAP